MAGALNLEPIHSAPGPGVNEIGLEIAVPVDELGEVEVGGEEPPNSPEGKEEQNEHQPEQPLQLEVEPLEIDVDQDQNDGADAPVEERPAIVVEKVLEIEGFEDGAEEDQ